MKTSVCAGSRYYKYSEESYMELMDKFDEKNIPFTVAVIDTYSLRQSPVILGVNIHFGRCSRKQRYTR